jgi:hypothetical protein
MRKLFPLILLLLQPAALFYAQTPPAPAASTDVFTEIDGIMADLSKITGLKPLRRVEYTRISRPDVKRFLEDRVKEAVKPEEIQAEEAALKKLGFAPPDFDLKRTTVDLLSEQAAAFYDYRKKKLFLIESGSDLLQQTALVHELAHALADQHFHLEKFIEHAGKDDDSSLARMAVMEGQATWLMSEYLTRRTGQSLKTSPVLVKMMSRLGDVAAGQFPEFDKAPLYLRETLLFPYTKGMLFQHAVVEKLDQAAFAEVFRRPPTSTQQILHPERYFQGGRTPLPALPELKDRHGYRSFTGGEMGELDHAVLLKQYAGQKDADELAPELRGGAYRIWEHRDSHRTVLAYASEWSSPEAAGRFFLFYRKVLQGKWKTFRIELDAPDRLQGQGDDGAFIVLRQGARVSSIEGMRSADEAK